MRERQAHAGHSGEGGRETGNDVAQPLLVHAERRRHRRVFGHRTRGAAEVGKAQQRPHRAAQKHGEEQRDELRQRHVERADLPADRAIGAFHALEVGGPDPLDRRLDDRRQAEGDEQRVQHVRGIARQEPVQRHAGEEEKRHGDGERDERIEPARELEGEVAAEEGEREMRQVHLAQQAPRQRQAEPEQSVQRADEDAGKYRLPEQRRARHLRAL